MISAVKESKAGYRMWKALMLCVRLGQPFLSGNSNVSNKDGKGLGGWRKANGFQRERKNKWQRGICHNF